MECYKIVGCGDAAMGSLCIECGNKFGDEDCKNVIENCGGYYLYKKERY